MKSYNVYIDSAAWFCEGNIVDASRIYRYMIENGHKITEDPCKADYIIINSCGFIQERIDRCEYLYNKFSKQKKENASIIIYGCLLKINPELINSFDSINIEMEEEEKFDKIFYNKVKFKSINPYCTEEIIKKLFYKKDIIIQLKYPTFFITYIMKRFSNNIRKNFNKIITNTSHDGKILVEICNGCTSNCNYCLIKKAKGNVKSRPIKNIIDDISKLYNPSKKLFLVADDCSCYGVDIKTNFFNLVDEISKKFPDLLIDIDTLNPEWVQRYPKEYVKIFKDANFNFVTIPVQSGSNKVLKNMNRRYDINKILKTIDEIKKVSPKTFIYSHFIIGYPGEGWIDFFKTLKSTIHFDFPIILNYSDHKGSKSYSLTKHNSRATIKLKENISNIFLMFIVAHKLRSHPKKL